MNINEAPVESGQQYTANFDKSFDSVQKYANCTPTDTFNYIKSNELSKVSMSDLNQHINFADLRMASNAEQDWNSEKASVADSNTDSCKNPSKVSTLGHTAEDSDKANENTTQSVHAMSERDSFGTTNDCFNSTDMDYSPKMKAQKPAPAMIKVEETPAAGIYKTPNYKTKRKQACNSEESKAKKTTKNPQEQIKKYGVKLSTRKDVVSKTLLRSIKRFYTEAFNEKFELSKTEKTDTYLEKITQFCQETFCTKALEMSDWNISMSEIIKFLSIIVSPTHIKFALKSEEDLSLYKEFYSCIYQYSHKKLNKMLSNKVCGFLFFEFVKEGDLERFITKCATMSQYPQIYRDMSSRFIETITKNMKSQDFY